jgi:hypothetical protein
VVEELNGDSYRVFADVEGHFEPGDAGAGVELVRGSITSTGQSSGELDELMPASGSSEGSTTMVMEVAGRRLEVVTHVEMDITSEDD